MQKIIVPPAVHFSGGGFYKTDAGAKQAETKSGTTDTKKTAPPSPPAA
jgi:predicted nucleic acid-binding Zn ribbon protein